MKKPARKRPVVTGPKREAWIEKRLAQGMRPTAVVRAAQEEWGLSESPLWALVGEIKARWLAESEATRPEARAEVLAQVDHLLATASEASDLSTAGKMLALKSELHGLRLKPIAEVSDASRPVVTIAAEGASLLDLREDK